MIFRVGNTALASLMIREWLSDDSMMRAVA
jgi:hypothetical protein